MVSLILLLSASVRVDQGGRRKLSTIVVAFCGFVLGFRMCERPSGVFGF